MTGGDLLYNSGNDRGSVTIWRSGIGREMGGSFGGRGHECTYG